MRPDFEEHPTRPDGSMPSARSARSTSGLLEIAAQSVPDNRLVATEVNRMEQLTALIHTLIEAETQTLKSRRLNPRGPLGSAILKLQSSLRRLRTRINAGLASRLGWIKASADRDDTK